MAKERESSTKKSNKKIMIAIIVAAIIVAGGVSAFLIAGNGGDKEGPSKQTSSITTAESESEQSVPVTDSQETTTEPAEQIEPEKSKEPVYPHSADITYVNTEAGEAPLYTDPLTGLASETDVSTVRPVAIMVNNIAASMPQVGVGSADILYECVAEGSITRLLMVTNDYASLEKVGSVRSSREYYIDFAKNHDAIYVHAGGSEEAYSQINSRDIEHLDYVRLDPNTGISVSSIFYRDPERLKTMSTEHTLVTSGQGILSGIATMGYRTVTADTHSEPMGYIDHGWKVELAGNPSSYVKIPYNTSRYDTQIVEYEYNTEDQKYYRYQFNHNEHIDGATGEQLAFENIIILELPHVNRGDALKHMDINTVGSGTGYYFTGGRYVPVNWSKASQDAAMQLTDSEGNPLIMNKGKTMINIVSSDVRGRMEIR